MSISQNRIPSRGADPIVPATLVIAKEGSSLNIDRADYVCSAASTSDQTIINTAINALPASGGSIQLLEGTFITDGNIIMQSNVKLIGSGMSTEIKLKNGIAAFVYMIEITNKINIIIKNLKLNGNSPNWVGSFQRGVWISNSSYCILKNVCIIDTHSQNTVITNNSKYIIIDKCIFINGSNVANMGQLDISGTNFNITNNTFINSSFDGIRLGGTNSIVNGNIIISSTQYGLRFLQYYNIVSNNEFIENSLYIGIRSIIINNIFKQCVNAMYGYQPSTTIINDNLCEDNTIGINITTCNFNMINSNNIINSLQDGIRIETNSNKTMVSKNHISKAGLQTDDTYSNIIIASNSDEINIQKNKCKKENVPNRAKYGIRINDATCNNTFVTNNDLINSGQTASFSDLGTGTVTAPGNRL